MASKEQLRKIRQKYHLGEYRKTKTARRVHTMARRRFTKSRSRKNNGSGKSGIVSLLSAIGYGAARVPISNAAQPLMDKLPFGKYNHEVLFGGSALAAKMLIRNKMVNDIATPIVYIEAAAAAQQATTDAGISTPTAAGIVYY